MIDLDVVRHIDLVVRMVATMLFRRIDWHNHLRRVQIVENEFDIRIVMIVRVIATMSEFLAKVLAAQITGIGSRVAHRFSIMLIARSGARYLDVTRTTAIVLLGFGGWFVHQFVAWLKLNGPRIVSEMTRSDQDLLAVLVG